ncbi:MULTISPECIES: metalloregulator ArsR/SmtB family transcription factor [Exiguobacterium]|uniref:ArsR/SmtB family transcription factor n=1 Tax=Exiguobacterium aestuarii TaxID=273527 RepID=A0ABW2PK60_9BACL|nr:MULTISPECIES: metalloregulator ArsR/SmtB family transcription factor [Exiguobacterium]MCA0980315.1 metalloregulator ArsR/SmtB family transcription factor [Exiguobacterium aestuarii]MCT4784827.1 metalloregulator ArsR/SmtB family transcription factor [Exiguobacterium aestuarii]
MKPLHHPSIDTIPYTKVLHALSEPNRLRIIRCLRESGENNCSTYSLELMLNKSTVSHHIKILREAGLIKGRIEGKEHYYSLRKDEIEQKFPGLLSSVFAVKDEDL